MSITRPMVVVVTPPQLAVTLAEARAHLRRDDGDDDASIAIYLAAAQGAIDGPDGWLGRAIGLQTLELTLDGFLGLDGRTLPFPPFVDLVSIAARAADGAWVDLAPSVYEATPWGGVDLALGQTWPTLASAWPGTREAVRIRYRAGYPDTAAPDGVEAEPVSTVPAQIRAAILLMTADLYDTRDGKVAANLVENPTIRRLLDPFRVWS